MTFRTSFNFNENTLVIEIQQNTYGFRQYFAINVAYVATTTLNPWILQNHEKIWYTITKTYTLRKNIDLCKLSCVFYHIHIKHEQTHFESELFCLTRSKSLLKQS